MNIPFTLMGGPPAHRAYTTQGAETLTLQTHKGFKRIRSSIQAIGLIDRCASTGRRRYVILDGYLRYRACED